MDLGATADRGVRGTVAVVASLALHAVILGLFIWSGSDSTPPAPEPSPAAESSNAESPSPAAEPPPPAAESPDNVATPPSASRPPRAEAIPAPKPVARPTPAPKPEVETKLYVVRRGDILAHIAQAHACTLQDLARLNGVPLKKLVNLRVGQKIKVPKEAPPAP